MGITQQLSKINDEFIKMHLRFDELRKVQARLDDKYASIDDGIRAKWDAERRQMEQTETNIMNCVRMARDNAHIAFGQPAARRSRPEPDKLKALTLSIDLGQQYDQTADSVILLAGEYIAYIADQRAAIDGEQQRELRQSAQAKRDELERLTAQKKQMLAESGRLIHSAEMNELKRAYQALDRHCAVRTESLDGWRPAAETGGKMLLGSYLMAIDVPTPLCGELAAALPGHFDGRTKLADCPAGISTQGRSAVEMIYPGQHEDSAAGAVQALVIEALSAFSPAELRISLLDGVYYNANILGQLSELCRGDKGVFDGVASSPEKISQHIALLSDYYNQVDKRLGAGSVAQYNQSRSAGERIPYRLLIINQGESEPQFMKEAKLAYVLNNSEKFGITTVKLRVYTDKYEKIKNSLDESAPRGGCVRALCQPDGSWSISVGGKWLPFKPTLAPAALPQRYIAAIRDAVRPKVLGNKFFERYRMTAPQRSVGPRRELVLPFGVDDDDGVVSCRFEGENFAAYIMGAAGSGKSTLLHTLISGLLMNYHPDEVELWLLDFKMLEFKRYVDIKPPHVKYLLLEKSEDLIFDIVDRLTELMENRQRLFSARGWTKLADVPVSENIPAIFVIIDEFAQMSQILKESKGMGSGDYTVKLENLLTKGRALGFKFIFSSQTYTTGVSGLTETACKQIQMRFAMKNTADEIKQTLMLSPDDMTPEISKWISSMPVYHTLFRWRSGDETDAVNRVGLFKNMYVESEEEEKLVALLNASLRPVAKNSGTGTYLAKDPVLIDGRRPKTFASQLPIYREYESREADERDESDVYIYPGVPCSFIPARPFVLHDAAAENILMAGGQPADELSTLMSVMRSYSASFNETVVWSHKLSMLYKKGRGCFTDTEICTDLEQICSQISRLKKRLLKKQSSPRLIVCLDYDLIANDLEILSDGAGDARRSGEAGGGDRVKKPSFFKLRQQLDACSEQEEKKRLLDEYNRACAAAEVQTETTAQEESGVYDARDDLKWLIKHAPSYGTHFLFCFRQGMGFQSLQLSESMFRHKLLFSMPRDEAQQLLGNRKASELEDSVGIYSSGTESYTFRPHIHAGLPMAGWRVDAGGEVVE